MTTPSQKNNSIRSWAEEERPREKLLLKGRSALTDAEILAIIIGSGSTKKSAVDLAREILQAYNFDINFLARAGIKDLQKFKGIGEAKAISIVAALEFSRRRKTEDTEAPKTLSSSEAVYIYFKPLLSDLSHEEFWVLLLDKSNKPIKHVKIGQGGISSVLADPKLIFKPALEYLSSHIIIVHNHPSGAKRPSQADKAMTKKIKSGAELLEITLLDHIIFTDQGHYSFSDNGEL